MKYAAGCLFAIFISVFAYWIFNENKQIVNFRDITSDVEALFKILDGDNDGVLNVSEFLALKENYTIFKKEFPAINEDFQQFPELSIQLGEQIINVDVSFEPLLLNSLKKNLSDLSEDETKSLQNLLNWKSPSYERYPFGSSSFSVFLPHSSDATPGTLWWIVEPENDKHSEPLSGLRFLPPIIEDQKSLPLHALLSLFHPHPFIYTRFIPQGTAAVVRAVKKDVYDIFFRIHAEFQLNKPPLHPFWFTPSQFSGRIIINKDASVVKFFHMEVPDTKVNVDMEWYNGPLEDSMEVDIGYIPKMSLISSAISVPINEDQANLVLSKLKWDSEISMEEALDALEAHFFPFRQLPYHSVSEAFAIAERDRKLVHGVLLWGNLADQSC